MEKKFNTNIIIVTWNAFEYTKLTLERLFETTHHSFMLTIIDNNSNDGTIEFLKNLSLSENCVKYNLVLNNFNKGYGGAINQGYEFSKKYNCLYTCVCNNDVFFQGNWLKTLEECLNLEEYKNIGILSPMRPSDDILDCYDRDSSLKCVVDKTPENYSAVDELNYLTRSQDFDIYSEKLIKKNGGGIYFLDSIPEAVPTYCVLIKNSVIDEVGYLADEQFETYGCEDLDFSWNVLSLGYKIAILKDLYVHHFRHKSITDSSLDREKFLIQNNNKLIKKWENEIFYFLKQEEMSGVNISFQFSEELDNHKYFFLKQVNKRINFLEKYLKIKDKLFIDNVDIKKPLGNFYRKNHVLILIKNNKNEYLMGGKEGYYPPDMARMLGGGLDDSEGEKVAAVRELSEELGVFPEPKNVFFLSRVITKANIQKKVMYMNVFIFGAFLLDTKNAKPGDDVTSILFYKEQKLVTLIKNMFLLKGAFSHGDFSYEYSDWGRVYGFIHEIALNKFKEYENTLPL